MKNIKSLEKKAGWVYQETLKINKTAPETRIASSLSCIEILTTLYYSDIMHKNPSYPYDPDRDRCIISKGHGSICLFPILADLGYFDKNELTKVCKAGSFLGGIPDPKIPGYETVNGSLGHGLGVACGSAIALKRRAALQDIFVLTGDGELQEGAVWEAIMFASHHQLDALNVIIDNNKISMLGFTDNAISHGNLAERLAAFGWAVYEVDGHNVQALYDTISCMKQTRAGKPKILIANTIKGRGVKGLENEALAHILTIKPEVMEHLLREDDA